jgi:galactokinase
LTLSHATRRFPDVETAVPDIRKEFVRVFGEGGRVWIVRAPGRVNLIGEHTDYNDGFVFPMAIEPEVRIACRAREDGLMRLASSAFPNQIAEFSIDKKIEQGKPAWANYMRGVAAEFLTAGIPLVGMDALYINTLPLGGGLSSSAAIEVGTARALLALNGRDIDERRLALLCQRAEHNYANVPCGIMDQSIVASGRKDQAMLLDCRDLSRTFITIDANELRVVIVNSMVRHELSGSEYGDRRRQCEEGVAHFAKSDPKIRALRDVTLDQLHAAKGALSEVVFRRCRHIITENARTTHAADNLTKRHYEVVGELMVQSHNSLRDDYEVSCVELDFLAAEAAGVKGVYGARMTGGGFGGCIVALTQPGAVERLSEHLKNVYPPKFGQKPGIYVTTATQGASVVS